MPLDLREGNRELYQLLIDNTIQGLLILQDDHIIFANKAVSEVSGYAPEELQSFSLKDLMAIAHPEDQERTFRGIGNLIAGNLPPVRQEFRIIRKDGAIRWVDTLASCIKYQARPALQLTYLDITERKRAEKSMRESEERFRALAENIPDLITRFDRNLQLLYANSAVLRRTGLPKRNLSAGRRASTEPRRWRLPTGRRPRVKY